MQTKLSQGTDNGNLVDYLQGQKHITDDKVFSIIWLDVLVGAEIPTIWTYECEQPHIQLENMMPAYTIYPVSDAQSVFIALSFLPEIYSFS